MNQIPTAEEVLKTIADDNLLISREGTVIAMIEFAKLHVEAALKAALKNAAFNNEYKYHPVPESILTAYPLTNVK